MRVLMVHPSPLLFSEIYQEFVKTQDILNRKHLGLRALCDTAGISLRLLARGQTNFIRMLWKFSGIYNVHRLSGDHERPVRSAIRLPEGTACRSTRPTREERCAHHPAAVGAAP